MAQPAQARREITWLFIWHVFLYVLWRTISGFLVFPVYFLIVSDGAKRLIPGMAQRLSQIPLCASLGQYKQTAHLHAGHVFAPLMLIGVLFLSEYVITCLLSGEVNSFGFKDKEMFKRLAFGLFTTLIVSDAVLFFLSVSTSSWGGGGFSFKAIIASICYMSFLLVTSFFAVVLRAQIPPR